MNLRIADAAGLVEALDALLRRAGEPIHSDGEWTVARVGAALFYCGPAPGGADDVGETPEVGGPYPTLGALVRDAGRRVAASSAAMPAGEPEWEVRAWARGFYVLRASQLEAPTRHETLEAALADAGP